MRGSSQINVLLNLVDSLAIKNKKARLLTLWLPGFLSGREPLDGNCYLNY